MHALPLVAPITGWAAVTRLPRDHYVRLAGNDYSVHPSAIGRRVEVAADLDTVTVTCAGQVVALHERCWAAHQSLTDPTHQAAASAMRSSWHAQLAGRDVIGAIPGQRTGDHSGRTEPQVRVQVRALADYDAMFAVAGPAPATGTGTGGRGDVA